MYVVLIDANDKPEWKPITSVTFTDTLVEVYTKETKSKYKSIFESLGIKVGFAQFLRILMAYESSNSIPESELKRILPNTSTNESLRIFLQNLETKKWIIQIVYVVK